jgi:hypothetical protein
VRRLIGVAMVFSLCWVTACSAKSTGTKPRDGIASSAASNREALAPGTTSLSCSDPIGILSSPTEPQSATLEVVGLDTVSTLQVTSAGGTAPHGLFAKTALFVHAGREADVRVPAGWSGRVSIAWGNHPAEWTTTLHIPACQQSSSGSDQWLVFPGGFSLDKAACVPVEIVADGKAATVHVSVGARCRG